MSSQVSPIENTSMPFALRFAEPLARLEEIEKSVRGKAVRLVGITTVQTYDPSPHADED